MSNISYSKACRANAASRGKDLFACGFAEAKGKGLSQFIGPMRWEMADALFAFNHMVYSGKTPSEAFAAINWPEQTP